MRNIAIVCDDAARLSEAQILAEQLSLPIISNLDELTNYKFHLIVTSEFLGVKDAYDKKGKPFYINFLSKQWMYRYKNASLRKELLAKAIGIHPNKRPFIIDATAGIGRDSFLLAALNYEITMVERVPILFYLLQDGLQRAALDARTTQISQRLTLLQTDAIFWLSSQTPDVVYLDPMFPTREKSAAVKKEMAFLHQLLGKDEDAEKLLITALACARYRVVVKRPRLGPWIAERKPSFSLTGTSSRFDIYQL